MTAKLILAPPPFAPGQGVAEILKDVVRTAFSETLAISTTLSTDVELFTVPANTIVLGIGAEVTTVFDGGTSDVNITIGDTDSATALFSMELSSLLAINTIGSLAKHYTAQQTIHAYLTPGEGVTGGLRFWLMFKTDSNVQEVGY